MTESVLLMEMTWPEVQKAIQQRKVLFFCVGAIEQHGPHLPLGVDVYLPMEAVVRAAEKVGGVVAPCTNYGYKSLLRSGGGPNFVGSIGLRGSTLISLVSDLIEEFISDGWRRILLLDWHIENVPFVLEGVDEAVRRARCDELKIVKIDNPNALAVNAKPELISILFGDDFPGWWVEHAAIWETSAMMAVRPSLVREGEIVDGRPPNPSDYDILPVPEAAAPETGVFWKATRSSAEKGKLIMAAVEEAIVEVVRREFESS